LGAQTTSAWWHRHVVTVGNAVSAQAIAAVSAVRERSTLVLELVLWTGKDA